MENENELIDGVHTVPKNDPRDIAGKHDFYTIDSKDGRIKFDKLKMVNKMRHLGYYRYDTPEGVIVYVHIKDRKMRIIETNEKLIDAFEDYIKSLPDRVIRNYETPPENGDGDAPTPENKITATQIQSAFYNCDMKRLLGGIMDRLRPEAPIEIMRDTKFTKYYYFNNVCVAVTKDGWRAIPYSSDELKGYIWESAIINRDFNYTDERGDFEHFCINICRDTAKPADMARFDALQSILGYLTHDFYELDLKAVYLTDINRDKVGIASGRTGKGLLGKACGCVLNRNERDTKYVAIPGKSFDHNQGNGTCYSMADISTQLIHIEDIDHKRFSFEDLYNDITDGAKMRKNYDRYPIVKHVKFMISSNQTINISGSSSRGRVCLFELNNYYSATHRPSDDFDRRFFESDWTEQDWNQFYSFMIRCSIEYLRNGLQEPSSVFYMQRRAVETLGQEIIDFIHEVMKAYPELEKNKRCVISKPFLLKHYQETRDRNYTDQKKITNWFRLYFNIMEIRFIEKRSTTDLFILNPDSEDRL